MLVSTAFAQSTFSSQLPVKERKGATVIGVVEADGKPLQGVVVSDGYEDDHRQEGLLLPLFGEEERQCIHHHTFGL